MTLLDPPPLPAGPAEGVARRVVFERVDWPFYQQMLAAVGDGPQRLTYDNGRLEVEVPSKDHERLKSVLRRLIETYAEERAVDLYAVASTTLNREDIDGGLEADEAWYVAGNARRMARDDQDDEDSSPPDLAVEIDLSSPSVRKEPVYRGLGVPELWRWRRDELTCLRLGDNGAYHPAAESMALAGFPFAVAADLLRRSTTALEARLASVLREWCRENP